MGSPALPTFEEAVLRGFLHFPTLTVARIRQNRPNPMATPQGHLHQQRQGVQSTHPPFDFVKAEPFSDTFPTEPIVPTHHLHVAIRPAKELTHRIHADAMGRFPVPSLHGAQYLLLFFHEDTNYIHVEAMPSRSTASYLTAFRSALQLFLTMGYPPLLSRLDNEISQALVTTLQHEFGITCELAPPNNHRTLRAERAIQTFKNHFISTLCTCDPSFPLYLWDDLLPQALLTLNLMRASAISPTLSAYEVLRGPFDFNRHPLLPLGMRVLCFENSKSPQRGTWDPHGKPGFYIGPSLPHYRCFRVFLPDTMHIRVTDTASWQPHHLHMPGSSSSELLEAAITDLGTCIQQHAPLDPTNKLVPSLLHELEDLRAAYHPPVSPLQRVAPAAPGEQRVAAPVLPLPPQPTPQLPLPIPPPVPLIPPPLLVPPPVPPLPTVIPTAPGAAPRTRRAPARYTLYNVTSQASGAAPPPPLVVPALRYGTLIRGPDASLWEAEHAKEFERLIETTKCMQFCAYGDVPRSYRIKYYKPVCTIKTPSTGNSIFRVRGTVADTQSSYDGPKSAATASINTVYLLLNATVSENAQWMTADIKDYYLGTPMSTPEYMSIPARYIPATIRARYNLSSTAPSTVRIDKGMYGLAQAGRLAQDRLKQHLLLSGYSEAPQTPCLYLHKSRPTKFSLVVDDFGIKYSTDEDRDHLLACLRQLYIITTDDVGASYLGLTINYNRVARTINVSMPGVIKHYLERYQFVTKVKPTFAPMTLPPVKYGSHQIDALPLDASPLLSSERTARLQSILGSLLHYSRVVDPSMLCSVNKLASSPHTETTEALADHLLDYASTLPNASITFHPSNMILQLHSDASYLSETKGRSRAGGYFFLGDYYPSSNTPPNGFIDTVSSIIDVVVSSAMEAESAAIFINAHHALLHRATLLDLGYPQPATTIVSDNAAAVNVLNTVIPPKRSRSMDMRFFWTVCRIQQGQFKLIWLPGAVNLADYFTKTHPTAHYKAIRSTFIQDPLLSLDKQRILLPALPV